MRKPKLNKNGEIECSFWLLPKFWHIADVAAKKIGMSRPKWICRAIERQARLEQATREID